MEWLVKKAGEAAPLKWRAAASRLKLHLSDRYGARGAYAEAAFTKNALGTLIRV